MKKLIYIFLLGLVFVACDKNDDNLDMQVLAPAEKEIVSISNDFDISSIDIDGLISRLTASTAKNNKKAGSEASKDATAGTSYISIFTGIINGNLFEMAFDDTQEFCIPDASGLTHLTLFYATNGNTEIKVGDANADTLLTLEVDLSFLYALDVISGVRINGSSKVVTEATLADNVFTF